jgi:uncharacterized membrane protein YkvA (DUF1232 family)
VAITGHAWLDAVLAIAVGMLVFWLLLVAMLALSRPQGPMLRAALPLLPDLVRLLHRLAADRQVPFGARARIVLLMIYLAIPIDLSPDFIPVLGYADDAIIITLVLRSVVRRAGLSAVRGHWPAATTASPPSNGSRGCLTPTVGLADQPNHERSKMSDIARDLGITMAVFADLLDPPPVCRDPVGWVTDSLGEFWWSGQRRNQFDPDARRDSPRRTQYRSSPRRSARSLGTPPVPGGVGSGVGAPVASISATSSASRASMAANVRTAASSKETSSWPAVACRIFAMVWTVTPHPLAYAESVEREGGASAAKWGAMRASGGLWSSQSP